MFVFSVFRWLPGGATLFKTFIPWPQDLTEIVVNISYFENNINVYDLKSCISD